MHFLPQLQLWALKHQSAKQTAHQLACFQLAGFSTLSRQDLMSIQSCCQVGFISLRHLLPCSPLRTLGVPGRFYVEQPFLFLDLLLCISRGSPALGSRSNPASQLSETSFPITVFWLLVSAHLASLVAQLVKNPPAMRETWVQSLGWEDPLEEGLAAHSNILGWRIAMDRGDWQDIVHGVAKSRTRLSD